MRFPDPIKNLAHFVPSTGVGVCRAIKDLHDESRREHSMSIKCHVDKIAEMLRRFLRRLQALAASAVGLPLVESINQAIFRFQSAIEETHGIITGEFASMAPSSEWVEYGKTTLQKLLDRFQQIKKSLPPFQSP